MKLIETTDDQKTVRLGIVKLGTAVGKMKYALIDEVDIPLIHEYKFDARLEIDRNGDGLNVIAMGHPKNFSSPHPIPLQNILWSHRNGRVEEGFKVCHLNGITMDNRVENLTLIPTWVSRHEQNAILEFRCSEPLSSVTNRVHNVNNSSSPTSLSSTTPSSSELSPSSGREQEKRGKRLGENSLYWKAITQLLANETDEQRNASSAPCSRAYYTTEGELISRDCPSFYFFECHYPPCTAIEAEPREFAMCGRCQQARYCGRECQRDDWSIHRDNCNESSHRRTSHSGGGRNGRRRGSGLRDGDR